MANAKTGQRDRERLRAELRNTGLNRAETHRKNARLDQEIEAVERKARELAAALQRVHPDEKAGSPQNKQLKEAVAQLQELQTERDQGDVEEEAAARAEQAVRQELENSLYKHLPEHLSAADQQVEWLKTKAEQLLPALRELRQEWDALVTEYKILSPALSDRLQEWDSSHGVMPPVSAYQRATTPAPWPLLQLEALATTTPRPAGVARFREQLKKAKEAA